MLSTATTPLLWRVLEGELLFFWECILRSTCVWKIQGLSKETLSTLYSRQLHWRAKPCIHKPVVARVGPFVVTPRIGEVLIFCWYFLRLLPSCCSWFCFLCYFLSFVSFVFLLLLPSFFSCGSSGCYGCCCGCAVALGRLPSESNNRSGEVVLVLEGSWGHSREMNCKGI